MSTPNLLDLGLFPPLATAFLEGRDGDLLEPLRFLPAGETPTGEPPTVDRRQLAEALGQANQGYGHPNAAALAAKLADPATAVVVTGQQPGLGGGPLYAFSKALAATLWAERIEASGQPAVAVFWVATEDHDFAEVSRTAVPVGRRLERLGLGADEQPLCPVGNRLLGEGVTDVMDNWRQAATTPHYQAWLDRVAEWYRPDVDFGDAFCHLLVGMLGERCPLLTDAMLPALKQAQSPFLARLIEERQAIESGFARGDEAIASRGYSLQVRPQRGASPLFLLHEGQRRRIEWRGSDRYGLRGLTDYEEGVESLATVAEREPERLSPGVLARPAIQDAVFGSYLQVLGPGEVSYMPQVAPLYECLEIEAPWVTARPQMLVLTARQEQRCKEIGLELADLVRGGLDIDAIVAAGAGDDVVAPVLDSIGTELESLREPILDLDRSLESPFEKTVGQIERALTMLAGKVAAASARRNDVERNRLTGLLEAVRPEGGLQERVIAGAHFVGRHERFVEAAAKQLGLDPRWLHLIDPEGTV